VRRVPAQGAGSGSSSRRCAPGFYDPPHAGAGPGPASGLPVDDRARAAHVRCAWGLGPIAAAAGSARRRRGAGAGGRRAQTRSWRTGWRAAAAAAAGPGLRVFGYTEEIPALMAAADLVITSFRGHLRRRHARSARSLLLLDVVQGHGRDNLQHELELGNADVASSRPRGDGPVCPGRA